MNITHQPRAPGIPNFLFQDPRNKNVPKVHSETPKNRGGFPDAEDAVEQDEAASGAERDDHIE